MTTARATLVLVFVSGCRFGLDKFDTSADTSGGEADADTDSDADIDTGGGGGGGGDADTDNDTDTDTDTDTHELDILSVDPDYSTTAGGAEVTIRGGPFDDSVVVWFGGERATVGEVNTNTLVVTEPGSAVEQYVDVEITSDFGTGLLDDGFYYYQDASGLAATVGVVAWYHMVGSYWETPQDWGEAAVYFVEPIDFHWWELAAPSMDTCRDEAYTTSKELYVLDPGMSEIALVPSSGSPLTATWDPKYYGFFNDDLAPAEYVANTAYQAIITGSSYLPDMEVDDFLKTTNTISLSAPAISGSSPPRVTRAQTFSWTVDTGDWVEIILGLRNASGSGHDQWLYCIANNDGSFNVDSSQWDAWPTGRTVDILFGRMREDGDTLPHNNGESRVVGAYYLYGAGTSQ